MPRKKFFFFNPLFEREIFSLSRSVQLFTTILAFWTFEDVYLKIIQNFKFLFIIPTPPLVAVSGSPMLLATSSWHQDASIIKSFNLNIWVFSLPNLVGLPCLIFTLSSQTKFCILFLKKGQTRPLLVYYCSFHNSMTNKAQIWL